MNRIGTLTFSYTIIYQSKFLSVSHFKSIENYSSKQMVLILKDDSTPKMTFKLLFIPLYSSRQQYAGTQIIGGFSHDNDQSNQNG